MPLKNEPKYVRVRLNDETKSLIDAESEKRGIPQQEILLRLLRFYLRQPDLLQLHMLDQFPNAKDRRDVAELLLRRMKRGK